MVYKYSLHCFSLGFGSECLQRRKKSLSIFLLDSKTKEDDKIVLQRSTVGFKLSRERQGLLILQDDKAPEKPIETTAESSFTSWLASGVSFLGCEAAKRETKSREVPRRIKIGRSTVSKVYCNGKEASRKTPGSGLLTIFPGKCMSNFKKMYRVKEGLAQLGLSGAKMKTARCKYITNEAFSTTERIEQSRTFEINCSSVVGFRFQLFPLCHYCCPFSGMHQH